MRDIHKLFVIILLVASVITLAMGLHKMYVYENPSSDESYYAEEDSAYTNAYVEGDAYNYIINAGRATALFIISGFLFLGAIGISILSEVSRVTKEAEKEKVLEGKTVVN